jgi:hypothetical protein
MGKVFGAATDQIGCQLRTGPRSFIGRPLVRRTAEPQTATLKIEKLNYSCKSC